jgi:hypothetical protein
MTRGIFSALLIDVNYIALPHYAVLTAPDFPPTRNSLSSSRRELATSAPLISVAGVGCFPSSNAGCIPAGQREVRSFT